MMPARYVITTGTPKYLPNMSDRVWPRLDQHADNAERLGQVLHVVIAAGGGASERLVFEWCQRRRNPVRCAAMYGPALWFVDMVAAAVARCGVGSVGALEIFHDGMTVDQGSGLKSDYTDVIRVAEANDMAVTVTDVVLPLGGRR